MRVGTMQALAVLLLACSLGVFGQVVDPPSWPNPPPEQPISLSLLDLSTIRSICGYPPGVSVSSCVLYIDWTILVPPAVPNASVSTTPFSSCIGWKAWCQWRNISHYLDNHANTFNYLPIESNITLKSASQIVNMTATAKNGRGWKDPALQHFTMSGCNLTGQLPSSISMLLNLRTLDLSANQLTGQLPPTWGGLALQRVDLRANLMSGTLSSDWYRFGGCGGSLDLSSNNLQDNPDLDTPGGDFSVAYTSNRIEFNTLDNQCTRYDPDPALWLAYIIVLAGFGGLVMVQAMLYEWDVAYEIDVQENGGASGRGPPSAFAALQPQAPLGPQRGPEPPRAFGHRLMVPSDVIPFDASTDGVAQVQLPSRRTTTEPQRLDRRATSSPSRLAPPAQRQAGTMGTAAHTHSPRVGGLLEEGADSLSQSGSSGSGSGTGLCNCGLHRCCTHLLANHLGWLRVAGLTLWLYVFNAACAALLVSLAQESRREYCGDLQSCHTLVYIVPAVAIADVSAALNPETTKGGRLYCQHLQHLEFQGQYRSTAGDGPPLKSAPPLVVQDNPIFEGDASITAQGLRGVGGESLMRNGNVRANGGEVIESQNDPVLDCQPGAQAPPNYHPGAQAPPNHQPGAQAPPNEQGGSRLQDSAGARTFADEAVYVEG
eukprot:gene12634-15865_t